MPMSEPNPAPVRASQHAQPDPDGALADAARRYRPALIRYFMRHLGCADDAEDLAQDALVRLARSPDVDGVVNVEAFLMRIAGNLLRDRFRRDRSHHVAMHLPFDESMQDWPGEEPGGDCVYEDRKKLQSFLRALDELPPRCRQVFLLQRFEGLTYSAIAKQLGISVSAVEKHMMRALLHFDACLEAP